MVSRRSVLKALSAIPALVRGGAYALGTPRSREYHVSPQGHDKNKGTAARPFRTIGAAAASAFPGDVITVHEGVYRERVSPARGGASDENRIVYRAAPGERVEITGAEVIKRWKGVQDDVWSVTIPNSFFGEFNPYSDAIRGDWFDARGRVHHTGAVYLNGDWLMEAATLDEVLHANSATPLWFGRVVEDKTTIWAQFEGVDPNQELTEINVRETVFYPEKEGVDFITVRGFILRRAATPWAPPTAEQKGVIGTHWSKGWVIEECEVSHSICCGIALGKYGDRWDNTSANSAEGYVKTIERAEQHGWSKENIGHHIVRNNRVSHCGQAGIVGSLGPAFSVVTGNVVHDIHVGQSFSGAEIAGIKFHAAIDVEISENHVYRTPLGLWLDWMAQGTRVSRNLFHDNDNDIFVEVDHGPFVIDNNLMLSKRSLHVNSQGGAFAHNLLLGGAQVNKFDARMTPFMLPHSTKVAGYHDNPSGDIRFRNNVFAQAGDLTQFNQTRLQMHLEGNVFTGDAKPCSQEEAPVVQPDFDPRAELREKSDGFYLEMTLHSDWAKRLQDKLVTSEVLGIAVIPNLPFENVDGGAIRIDRDFSGRQRDVEHPFPGPFEAPQGGRQVFKVS